MKAYLLTLLLAVVPIALVNAMFPRPTLMSPSAIVAEQAKAAEDNIAAEQARAQQEKAELQQQKEYYDSQIYRNSDVAALGMTVPATNLMRDAFGSTPEEVHNLMAESATDTGAGVPSTIMGDGNNGQNTLPFSPPRQEVVDGPRPAPTRSQSLDSYFDDDNKNTEAARPQRPFYSGPGVGADARVEQQGFESAKLDAEEEQGPMRNAFSTNVAAAGDGADDLIPPRPMDDPANDDSDGMRSRLRMSPGAKRIAKRVAAGGAAAAGLYGLYSSLAFNHTWNPAKWGSVGGESEM